MKSGIKISQRLAQWAKLAGYTLTSGESTDDGRAVLSAGSGEIRLFLGQNHDGYLVLTDSDRMGKEHFILAAPSLDTMEKYLYGRFCLHLRNVNGLPRVGMPVSDNALVSTYNVETREFDGSQHFALIASDGSTVAISSTDKVTAAAELKKLAVYLSATIDQIEASAGDPDGKPLFEPR